MIGPVGDSVHLVGRRFRDAVRRPTVGGLLTVAGIPVVALGAAGLIWSGLVGTIGLLAGALLYPTLIRAVDGAAAAATGHGIGYRRVVMAFAAIGAFLSIPITAGFLSSDLAAIAAPAISAVITDVPVTSGDLVYGSHFPPLTACSPVQMVLGVELSRPCYAILGYLHLWQIPAAIPIVLSITTICMLIPILVLLQLHEQERA